MNLYISQKIKTITLMCMVMVVAVHAYNLPERYLQPFSMVQEPLTVNNFLQLLIANGLTRFGVPLFFLISGYLNYPKSGSIYIEAVRKRFRTLVVPYLIWSAFGLLLYWAVQHNDFFWQVTQKANLGSLSDVKVGDYSWSQMLYRWIIEPIPFQLWFIRCLFAYCLLVPLLLRGIDRLWKWKLLFFALLWFFNIGFYFIEGTGLLFFTLGLMLRHREVDMMQAPTWFKWKTAALIWAGLLLLKTGLAFGEYNPVSVALQLILFRMCEALGVLVIWFGYDKIMQGRLPGKTWLGLSSYTFIIYGLHVPLLHLISESLLIHYGETDATRGWVYAVTVIGTTGICILAGFALRRLALPVFSVLTGNRGV
jgi:fucose 4-O-acetylase-like acetyltransferase